MACGSDLGICILNMYMSDLDVSVGLGTTRAELPEALVGVRDHYEKTARCVYI